MLHSHFQKEMSRLELRFGEKAANEEFCRILWDKLKNIDDKLFTYAIDYLALSKRFAPNYFDFVDAINSARAKTTVNQQQNTMKEFLTHTDTDPEEIKRRKNMIVRRMKGLVSDYDFYFFQLEVLQSAKDNGEYGKDERGFRSDWNKTLKKFQDAGGSL